MPAEKTWCLWILRALQQISCVSHMAREICGNSTKTYWSAHSYQEYRRLLDAETMAVCQIYGETKLANLLVREGKKAKEWLTSAHEDAEYAREHIDVRLRRPEELRAGRSKETADDLYVTGQQSRERVREEALQARLQVNRMPGPTPTSAGGEMRRLIIKAAVEEACSKSSGHGTRSTSSGDNREDRGSCESGDRHLARIAALLEKWEDFAGEVEDKGDKGDPQTAIRGQAGHLVPANHRSCRFQRWSQGSCTQG
jgi:hypothetical protein